MKTIISLLILAFSVNFTQAEGVRIVIKKQKIPSEKVDKWTEQLEFNLMKNNEVFSKEQLRIYIDWVLDQIKQGYVKGKMMIYDGWLLSWISGQQVNEFEEQLELVEIMIEDQYEKP